MLKLTGSIMYLFNKKQGYADFFFFPPLLFLLLDTMVTTETYFALLCAPHNFSKGCISVKFPYPCNLNNWLLQHILHRPHWEIPHKSFRWCDTQLPVCLEELASEKNMLLPVLGWQHHFCTIFWKQPGCWLWSIKFWISSIWENTFLLIQCSWNWEQLQNFRSQHSDMDIKRHSRWRVLCPKQQLYLWVHEIWIIFCHIKQTEILTFPLIFVLTGQVHVIQAWESKFIPR